ncbi:Plasmodium variant antigen protein Cir/Yir/Bir, putative [Plasmodium chabaudi adami]|uniref:Plasmodium variant antigen protein Cir/Yir/Bir, putative n=1 Tax=Plasmodium chabaudi adami TaxID=5826 RepID=A0A1D3L8C4_PLACE|nr:Plasmodium variant antigen protein Cir/Yir/Bir, putative [Plasmodium chabaudi adami]
MEQSNDNLKDLYDDIFKINYYFYVTEDGAFRVDTEHKSIVQYCNYENNSGAYDCNDYFQLAICSVIHLLKKYKYKLEDDKLAEYVILWLSYKLNTVEVKCSTNLNDFYTNHIEKNEYYNKNINGDDTTTYKDIIDKIKNLMNTKEISKFNDPFGMLLSLYHVIGDESTYCKTYSNYPEKFVNEFEKLNKDSNDNENSSYNKLLSTLSDDYNNLKNIYDNNYKNKCPNLPSFPELTPKKKPVEISLQTSEGTSSSSSILNTVIPVLSTFSVISLFLGVAYKYSLFGFGKRSQKRYLRENIKK